MDPPPQLVPSSRKRCLLAEEATTQGKMFLNEEKYRVYCIIGYQVRFNKPDKADWGGSIISSTQSEIGFDPRSICRIFTNAQNGDGDYTKQKPGSAGRKQKLARNNDDLVAATLALNYGIPPSLAT